MTEIIIGAGASGLACAIRLKQNMPNDEVILLERLDTLGKKILATGNGRCNLSNEHAKHYKEVINFFNNIGLKTKSDSEGRIYPYSNQAATVRDMLEKECIRLGVQIITTARAEFILIQIKPQPSEICLKKNVSGLECKSLPTARLKALTGI